MTAGRELKKLQQDIEKMSLKETKELLLMSMYKLSLVRSQMDALTDLLVKKKLIAREQLWKETNERFEDQSF